MRCSAGSRVAAGVKANQWSPPAPLPCYRLSQNPPCQADADQVYCSQIITLSYHFIPLFPPLMHLLALSSQVHKVFGMNQTVIAQFVGTLLETIRVQKTAAGWPAWISFWFVSASGVAYPTFYCLTYWLFYHQLKGGDSVHMFILPALVPIFSYWCIAY